MLKYFGHEIFEVEGESPDETITITVGQYVVGELDTDGLKSVNQDINRMLDIFRENTDHKNFDATRFFINYPEAGLSRMASDLLAEKYVESKRWGKSGAFVEAESDILDILVPRIVQEYKLKQVKAMLKQIEKKIKQASTEGDFEKIMDMQNQYINLKKVGRYLSEQLGFRAIN